MVTNITKLKKVMCVSFIYEFWLGETGRCCPWNYKNLILKKKIVASKMSANSVQPFGQQWLTYTARVKDFSYMFFLLKLCRLGIQIICQRKKIFPK